MHPCEAIHYEPSLHLELIQAWFKARKFPAPNPKFLPPTGILVLMDEKPICAGFLFKTDAQAAVIGHLVSDPFAGSSERNQGLDYLIMSLLLTAKDEGYNMVCCSTNLETLMERFENLGFQKTDSGVSQFGRVFECH